MTSGQQRGQHQPNPGGFAPNDVIEVVLQLLQPLHFLCGHSGSYLWFSLSFHFSGMVGTRAQQATPLHASPIMRRDAPSASNFVWVTVRASPAATQIADSWRACYSLFGSTALFSTAWRSSFRR